MLTEIATYVEYLTQHMIHCLCSDLVMHLSFFARLFHLQPHIYLPQLNFSVFFIENTVPQNLNTIIVVNVLLSTNRKLNFIP